ncbi:MAG: hypothetical protein ACKVT0_22680 [Planctomycetaceae bacterium]
MHSTVYRFATSLFTRTFLILGVGLCGCDMLHNLQPHRLQRLNRSSPPSGDPYFSISDPVTSIPAKPSPKQAFATENIAPAPKASANPVAPVDEFSADEEVR